MYWDSIEIWRLKLADGDVAKLTRAVLATVVSVAEQLLHQKAFLLSHASKHFMEAYTGGADDSNSMEINLVVED